ncbi:MAG TPA: winged helix-turn-helix domain-containing protein [Caulobacteraceae bacterium]|jgi:TolB-like protein
MAEPPPIDLAREADFVLGGMEVRPRSRELVAGGKAEILEPRIMQVLVALAQRRGQVVTRDELTWSCWGGRIVGEDAIYRCIQAIRQRAQAHGGFAVATVSRVGYRLDESALPFAKPALTIPVLAVLAFDNLSGDPDMAWFSDGLSEEILQTVARGADLKVIGRGSSFHFRGAQKAAAHVAGQLNVTHVLDGSVRRSGADVRISAHLVECAGQTVLWSHRFDRQLTDVFALQDELAAAVAGALKVAFAPPLSREPVEPAIYDLYLKARDLRFQGASDYGHAEAARALELLEQVVEGAPTFARAWADLAYHRAHCLRMIGPAHFPALTRAHVVQASETAAGLDPGAGIARQALSLLEPHAEYQKREVRLMEGLAAAPDDPEALKNVAGLCAEVGRLEDALSYAEQALRSDPIYWAWTSSRAYLMDAMGRNAETGILWDACLEAWPTKKTLIIEAMIGAGGAKDWARVDELMAKIDGHDYGNPWTSHTILFLRETRRPNPEFERAELEACTAAMTTPGRAALWYVFGLSQLGMIEEAFDLIDRASFAHIFAPDGPTSTLGSGNAGIIFHQSNALMIRDPRFPRLCAKLGLCDYWVATDRWPDCADSGALAYDFKAECRRLAGSGLPSSGPSQRPQ